MEKKITLSERFFSETPAFFKKAQVFGAGLVVLSVSLSEIKIIPSHWVTVIASVGATIAAVAQFAVKQYEPLDQPSHEKQSR